MIYGLPYMGSKSCIAKWLVDILPPADVFVDLFFGGGAMTHCAMLSGKFHAFVANDIQGDMPRLFCDAVSGKYHDETRWISRDDFFHLKDTDPYVHTCWSFGNNNRCYLYGRTIEPYKKACHYAIVLDDWGSFKELCPEVFGTAYGALQGITDRKQRRMKFGSAIVRRLKEIGTASLVSANPLYRSCHTRHATHDQFRLESMERLQSLERLERLQSLESLERLRAPLFTTYALDYQDVPIPPRSTVYADPPYHNTSSYGQSFDHPRFYHWLRHTTFPVHVSELSMPPDFIPVASHPKEVTLCSTHVTRVTECLFLHKRWL